MTRARWLFLAQAILFLAIVAGLIDVGFRFRHWTWDNTPTIRYAADMNNAWNWGSRADHDGYFPLYDHVIAESHDQQYGLDYVPLRLAVMTRWAHWATATFPQAEGWQSDYAFNAPLLRLNTGMELAAAIGTFFLVRFWIRKEREPHYPLTFFTGSRLALLAAALVWMNAASVFSAHARPTWDVWVIPFYVWAVYFASRNFWLTAGAIIGVGAMLKGQVLILSPFFLLWPIFSLRFGAAARWVIGLGLAAGLIVSPWQVRPSGKAISLCVAAALLGVIVWAILRGGGVIVRRIRSRGETASDFGAPSKPAGVRAFACNWLAIIRGRIIPRWWPMWLSLAALAGALWIAPPLFHTSTAWRTIGFEYGVTKMPNLESGGAANLAAILEHRYDWESATPVDLPATRWQPTMKTLLLVIGYALIALCAAAAAWHASRSDRRFLLAAAAPWLVYFTVFPLMHERYLLWAALMTAVAASIDVGLLGVHLLITAFAWTMQMDQLLRDGRNKEFAKIISPTFGHSLSKFTHSTVPDSGWAILTLCVVWLWMMFAARSRKPVVARRSPRFSASSLPPAEAGGSNQSSTTTT